MHSLYLPITRLLLLNPSSRCTIIFQVLQPLLQSAGIFESEAIREVKTQLEVGVAISTGSLSKLSSMIKRSSGEKHHHITAEDVATLLGCSESQPSHWQSVPLYSAPVGCLPSGDIPRLGLSSLSYGGECE